MDGDGSSRAPTVRPHPDGRGSCRPSGPRHRGGRSRPNGSDVDGRIRPEQCLEITGDLRLLQPCRRRRRGVPVPGRHDRGPVARCPKSDLLRGGGLLRGGDLFCPGRGWCGVRVRPGVLLCCPPGEGFLMGSTRPCSRSQAQGIRVRVGWIHRPEGGMDRGHCENIGDMGPMHRRIADRGAMRF